MKKVIVLAVSLLFCSTVFARCCPGPCCPTYSTKPTKLGMQDDDINRPVNVKKEVIRMEKQAISFCRTMTDTEDHANKYEKHKTYNYGIFPWEHKGMDTSWAGRFYACMKSERKSITEYKNDMAGLKKLECHGFVCWLKTVL